MGTPDWLIHAGWFVGMLWGCLAAIFIAAWTAVGLWCVVARRRRQRYDESWAMALDTLERWCVTEFPQVSDVCAYLRHLAWTDTPQGIEEFKAMLRRKYAQDYSKD